MATTKIWAVKDSLSRVVSYAENPEKTIFDDLKQVLNYAENEDKTTADSEEKSMYVTGVNCNRGTAFEEMIQVQKRFNKTVEILHIMLIKVLKQAKFLQNWHIKLV